jgi:hypothetical protein
MEVTLVLHEFLVCNFALTRIETLYRFSNLHDKFRFNAVWHRRSVVTVIFRRRLSGSHVTVTPSVTCMDYVGVISTRLI